MLFICVNCIDFFHIIVYNSVLEYLIIKINNKLWEMFILKKKISALICGTLMAFSAVSFASLEPDRIMLGGMQPGMRINEVAEMYGDPLRREGDKVIYDGFYVELINSNSIYIEEIVALDGRLGTFDGVEVGYTERDLRELCGNPDKIDSSVNSSKKEFTYYSNDNKTKLEFTLERGIVTKISCEAR